MRKNDTETIVAAHRGEKRSTIIFGAFLVIFDLVMLYLGYAAGFFKILNAIPTTDPSAGNAVVYEVNNSNLMIVIAICLINVLSIYHIVSKTVFYRHLKRIDETGHISEGLSKIEAHLINYDSETIAFSHLSAIEHEVGIERKDTHNEIWIVSNDFEENKDSFEGKELRHAIIDNLTTNVDYYYVISPRYENDLKALGEKLKLERKKRALKGKFQYYVDGAFDFLPTPYYDIILYIKVNPGGDFIESSSQIYYCFSRYKNSEKCYYQKVEEDAVWDQLTECIKNYRDNKKPIVLLQ